MCKNNDEKQYPKLKKIGMKNLEINTKTKQETKVEVVIKIEIKIDVAKQKKT